MKAALRLLPPAILAALGPGLAGLTGCSNPALPPGHQVDFATEIKPIFRDKCVMCHNQGVLVGRPGFVSAEEAFWEGPRGTTIVPGNPGESRVVQVLRAAETSEDTMPPAGHRVTARERALLEAWIRQGAHWPEGEAGRIPYDPVPFDDSERGIVHPDGA